MFGMGECVGVCVCVCVCLSCVCFCKSPVVIYLHDCMFIFYGVSPCSVFVNMICHKITIISHSDTQKDNDNIQKEEISCSVIVCVRILKCVCVCVCTRL